jgi:hypothetical protein
LFHDRRLDVGDQPGFRGQVLESWR